MVLKTATDVSNIDAVQHPPTYHVQILHIFDIFNILTAEKLHVVVNE